MSSSATSASPQFASTRWSVVLRAGQPDAPDGREALAGLCRTYWYPLYAHVRRRGASPPDAEDLTQEFFARLLARGTVAAADRNRGRFRTFLLTAFDRFVIDEWQKARAQKRGGTQEFVSLDFASAEERFQLEAEAGAAPERTFDRAWALALLREVLGQLEHEYRAAGRADLFSALAPTLTGAGATTAYATLGSQLGMSEGAVKVAVHRLRKRYRALLQAAIAETVASEAEAGAELQWLLEALRG